MSLYPKTQNDKSKAQETITLLDLAMDPQPQITPKNESVTKINRFKLLNLLEQSIELLPIANKQQRARLQVFIQESNDRLKSERRPNLHHTEHDIELLERELSDKGICFWPEKKDKLSEQYMMSNIRNVFAHSRKLPQILKIHFNDTVMSENKFNRILKELTARNNLRELSYVHDNSNITESIDYSDPQLNQVMNRFNDYTTGNTIAIDDEICVLQLEILKFHPRFRGSITLTGFTRPKKIVAIDDHYIYFEDHTRWPDIKNYRNLGVSKQTIYFKNSPDSYQCATAVSLLSTKSLSDTYDVRIYVDENEPLDQNTNESTSVQQILDYLEESVVPQDLHSNNKELAKKSGHKVWWKQSMVGVTTGVLTDLGVEFRMQNDNFEYLPLKWVSIREK